MSRRIRLWRHDGLYRIQFYSQLDRHGILVDMWSSHRRRGVVQFFETEQQAREYMQSGGKL